MCLIWACTASGSHWGYASSKRCAASVDELCDVREQAKQRDCRKLLLPAEKQSGKMENSWFYTLVSVQIKQTRYTVLISELYAFMLS